MRAYLLSIVATMGACTAGESHMLDRMAACQAQADAWCQAAGYPSGGCAIWYTHEQCAAGDLEVPIPADLQEQCLADIAPRAPAPESCVSTWSLTR